MSKEFDDFMEDVKAIPDYPELEGTMNLCNDIIIKREISDEEILKAAIDHSNLYINKFTPRNAFFEGAKWYREQLKQRQ